MNIAAAMPVLLVGGAATLALAAGLWRADERRVGLAVAALGVVLGVIAILLRFTGFWDRIFDHDFANVWEGVALNLLGAGFAALVLGALMWLRAPLLVGRLPAVIGIAGIVGAMVASAQLWTERIEVLDGGLRADRFSMLLNGIFLTAALAVILLGLGDPAAVDRRGEFVALILSSTAGMMLVAGAGDLITLFVGVELLSVALYVLAALEVWRERSLEAGLKYLIIGAVGSAFLLYGLAFLFGATGSLAIDEIGRELAAGAGSGLRDEPLVLAAIVLIIVGLGFKASAAPFHMWTPDVYEGAPTVVTTYMSTATKAAALAAFLRIFGGALGDVSADWTVAIGLVAAAAILVGNIAALRQENLKRMLAYSSVAQAGFLLIGVASGGVSGGEATLYYLVAYTAMTVAAFAVVVIREREVEDGEMLGALAGYGRSRPMLGVAMTLAMLSLAGFPPLSGFVGKFLLFGAAVEADMFWLAVVGAVGSIISLGYYLRVVAVVWLGEPPASAAARRPKPAGADVLVTLSSAAAILLIALFTSPLLRLCQGAAESVLGI